MDWSIAARWNLRANKAVTLPGQQSCYWLCRAVGCILVYHKGGFQLRVPTQLDCRQCDMLIFVLQINCPSPLPSLTHTRTHSHSKSEFVFFVRLYSVVYSRRICISTDFQNLYTTWVIHNEPPGQRVIERGSVRSLANSSEMRQYLCCGFLSDQLRGVLVAYLRPPYMWKIITVCSENIRSGVNALFDTANIIRLSSIYHKGQAATFRLLWTLHASGLPKICCGEALRKTMTVIVYEITINNFYRVSALYMLMCYLFLQRN